MHTGLDFRASSGDPVRATAYGKVIASGWQGGYGKMVEIDHGNTLTTRYGHLSEINVKIGDIVRIGQVIGAVGSITRPASTAMQSIRRSSCARVFGSDRAEATLRSVDGFLPQLTKTDECSERSPHKRSAMRG